MISRYRIVPDFTKDDLFGCELTIDEQALLLAMSEFIGKLKDKYSARHDVLKCRLVPAPDSFTCEPRV